MLQLRVIFLTIPVSSLWSPTERQRSRGDRAAHGLAGWKQRRGADFLRVLAADWETGGQTGRFHSVELPVSSQSWLLSRLCNTNRLNSSRPTQKAFAFFYRPTNFMCNSLVNHLLNAGNFELKASLSWTLSHQHSVSCHSFTTLYDVQPHTFEWECITALI